MASTRKPGPKISSAGLEAKARDLSHHLASKWLTPMKPNNTVPSHQGRANFHKTKARTNSVEKVSTRNQLLSTRMASVENILAFAAKTMIIAALTRSPQSESHKSN